MRLLRLLMPFVKFYPTFTHVYFKRVFSFGIYSGRLHDVLIVLLTFKTKKRDLRERRSFKTETMTLSWVGDVYVGAETGLVKSVQLHNQNWMNLGGKPSEAKRENEILRMCWANDGETQMLLGLRSGDVFKGMIRSLYCVWRQ